RALRERRGARGACRSRVAGRCHAARQRLAFHAHGARGDGADGRKRRSGALMLLWLSEWLAKDVRAFNVFGYISLRAVLATMTALVISFLVGPRMIAWLTRMRIGQAVRNDGPQTHLT